MHTLDAAALLDEGRLSRYQRLLVFGTALAVILDGVDNQLLANAVPAMMAEWRLPRAAFATAAAAGPLGMILGGVLGGMLGDRAGRRVALLGSVLTFAALTLSIAFVDSVAVLTVLRLVAGVGLGGAMPSATALASEYVPRRHRPLAITLTIVCIPLGGFLAGLLAGRIIPAFGWRVLFVAGGIATIGIALALLALLPESPQYLAAHPPRWRELRAVLARIGYSVPDEVGFVAPATASSTRPRVPLRELVSPALRRDTLGLVAAFFFCLLAIYVGFLWIPAMLADPHVGFSQAQASYALSLFNFGGVGGAVLGAVAIGRVGSRPALLAMSALASLSAFTMTGLTLDPGHVFSAMMMFTVTGGLLNAVQTTMYALAAHVYPTAVRGTGVGATVACGRVGNTLASYVGSWALTVGGPTMVFVTWGVAMAIVLAALASVRNHVPAR
jgi:AAHS family 4-hydroxybenzoate transporter-like MFS transporter